MDEAGPVLCCAVWLQVIELPLKHPELFESLGIAQPKVRPVSGARQFKCHLLCTGG